MEDYFLLGVEKLLEVQGVDIMVATVQFWQRQRCGGGEEGCSCSPTAFFEKVCSGLFKP